MSRWSRNRQFAYLGGLLLVVLVLAGYFFYVYEPVVNCFDQRQNGNETGIDCGGDCPQLCLTEVRPLQVVWARVLPVAPGLYAAAARVNNLNQTAGVARLRYTFRLVDERNILVTFRSGETFVNPGENLVIFEGGINTGSGRPSRAFLEFETPRWEKSTSTPALLVVEDKHFINDAPARLEAVVINRSIIDLPRVEVVALLSDEAGNVLSAGATYLERLGRDSAKTAFFAWPEPLPKAPSFIDVYPRVSVFAPR